MQNNICHTGISSIQCGVYIAYTTLHAIPRNFHHLHDMVTDIHRNHQKISASPNFHFSILRMK